jgi:hypothetical protein
MPLASENENLNRVQQGCWDSPSRLIIEQPRTAGTSQNAIPNGHVLNALLRATGRCPSALGPGHAFHGHSDFARFQASRVGSLPTAFSGYVGHGGSNLPPYQLPYVNSIQHRAAANSGMLSLRDEALARLASAGTRRVLLEQQHRQEQALALLELAHLRTESLQIVTGIAPVRTTKASAALLTETSAAPVPNTVTSNCKSCSALASVADAAETAPEKMDAAPPRRPLTAYNIFFRCERAKLLGLPLDDFDFRGGVKEGTKARPHRKSHGKIPFADLAKHVAKEWKGLEPAIKEQYNHMARRELEAYRKEKKEFMQRRVFLGAQASSPKDL